MTDPFLTDNPRENNNNSSNISNNTNTSGGNDSSWWTKNKRTQHVKSKVKKWSTISVKTFLIWCWFFWLLMLLLVIVWLFIALNNAESLESLWLNAWTTKSLLMFFAVLFFWILFVAGFLFFLLNIYRLITAKSWKIKYWIWTWIWFMLFFFSITFWVVSFNIINWLSSDQTISTNNLIDPFLQTENWDILLIWGMPKIAPAYIRYRLNRDIFTNQILSKIWVTIDRVKEVTLDCDNWQTPIITDLSSLFWWVNNWMFSNCLYFKQWIYSPKLDIEYIWRSGLWTESYKVDNFFDIEFKSEIMIEAWWKIVDNSFLNQSKEEIIVWTDPVFLSLDTTKIFTDYKIMDYWINRRFNWQPVWNEEIVLTQTLDEPKTHIFSYNIPSAMWDNIYSFYVRVEPSRNHDCYLDYNKLQWNNYRIKYVWPDIGIFDSFEFYEENQLTKETKKINKSSEEFTYSLWEWWEYKIYMKYEENWKISWTCSSSVINTNFKNFEIKKSIWWKTVSNTDYNEMEINENNEILVEILPYDIRLNVDSILPDVWNNDFTVMLDDREIRKSWLHSYDFNITEEWTYELKLIIWKINEPLYQEDIDVVVKKKPVIAILEIEPDTWMDPLKVDLDASLSQIIDETDEIIYFTWNFWDWEILKKVSQWKLSHIYHYDEVERNWEYDVSVTIETKNGFKDTAKWKVFVKKKVYQPEILILPPHSQQIARKWDRVTFSVDSDWTIESIYWDFDNWKTDSWTWRKKMNASTIYDQSWKYKITATVNYKDSPTEKVSINLVVK